MSPVLCTEARLPMEGIGVLCCLASQMMGVRIWMMEPPLGALAPGGGHVGRHWAFSQLEGGRDTHLIAGTVSRASGPAYLGFSLNTVTLCRRVLLYFSFIPSLLFLEKSDPEPHPSSWALCPSAPWLFLLPPTMLYFLIRWWRLLGVFFFFSKPLIVTLNSLGPKSAGRS